MMLRYTFNRDCSASLDIWTFCWFVYVLIVSYSVDSGHQEHVVVFFGWKNVDVLKKGW
jgi:hypothetical protein